MRSLPGIRADFPIFDGDSPRLVYLDSAASSQKPRQVLDAVTDFQATAYANVHRGAYRLSAEATDRYEGARHRIASFIGASDPAEVVFTRGATSALNAIASSWGDAHLGPDRAIMLSLMEHHANVVPWQQAAKRTGASLVYVGLDEDFQLDLDDLEAKLDERTAVVAVTGMSNVLGSMPPLRVIADAAHQAGAVVVADGAQLVPHAPVDVTALGVDFLVFSGHKMLGPTGIGVLWGRRTLLEAMEPWETGGEMIADVGLYESTWAPLPNKLEAGTPPIAQAIGLGAAVDYLTNIGMAEVRRHDMDLTSYALERIAEIDHIEVYGPRNVERRGSAISFTMGDIHPHDLATILDSENVSIRAGHHCAKPLMNHLGVAATARASFSVYNDETVVAGLAGALHKAGQIFGLV